MQRRQKQEERITKRLRGLGLKAVFFYEMISVFLMILDPISIKGRPRSTEKNIPESTASAKAWKKVRTITFLYFYKKLNTKVSLHIFFKNLCSP